MHGTGNPADQVLPDAAENMDSSLLTLKLPPTWEVEPSEATCLLAAGALVLMTVVPRVFRFQPCRADAFRGVIAPWLGNPGEGGRDSGVNTITVPG